MRGAAVDLVQSIAKPLFRQTKPKWVINRKSTDPKPFLRGTRLRKHWPHLGWSTGKMGTYLEKVDEEGKKVFVPQPWRFRELVVPELSECKVFLSSDYYYCFLVVLLTVFII